jgi:Zn-dependent M16 (insulinase) family peptidase
MDLLYPRHTAPCGYSAETGGKVANIRALDVGRVRRYHEEYYSPDNVLLILTGNVRREDFFGALDEVESVILERRRLAAETMGRSSFAHEMHRITDGIMPLLEKSNVILSLDARCRSAATAII